MGFVYVKNYGDGGLLSVHSFVQLCNNYKHSLIDCQLINDA